MTATNLTMEQQYLAHLDRLMTLGRQKHDRTGTGTVSIFGHQMRCDLRDGFPLLTTKKIHLKSVIVELLWFLNGDTNIKYLQDNGVRIWNEWADENGGLGPVYGKQWRSWACGGEDGGTPFERTVDQISEAIDTLSANPDSRRIIVSSWNVADLPAMALAPCHCLFQFHSEEMTFDERLMWCKENWIELFEEAKCAPKLAAEGLLNDHNVPRRFLSCQLYQRSADWFLGVPFNIASYALLTMMMAREVNMVAKDFVHTFGDSHLYLNHVEQAHEQLSREPRAMPVIDITDRNQGIFDYQLEDFQVEGYDPHPTIRAEVAV